MQSCPQDQKHCTGKCVQLKQSTNIRLAHTANQMMVAKHSNGVLMQCLLVKGINVLVAKYNCLRLLRAFDQHLDFAASCSFCF